MPTLLFKIPLTRWIRKTIERMDVAGKDDIKTWSISWFKTYTELGGTSGSSGSKGCPKHAAYGLWYLGRIVNSGRDFQKWPLDKINKKLGKNVVYAVLALDLLEYETYRSEVRLWAKVQELYQQKFGEQPARSEQGAVRIALGLFAEGQIASKAS